jgi:nitrite reductase/ring-hydroxylating ferredoxin subunit
MNAAGERRAYLCAEAELGSARGIELDDISLLLVRRGDAIFAYENRCPHRGTSLDWLPGRFMSADGELLQCATHGALFRVEDGLCVSGPCVREHLTALRVERVDGKVWLVR